MDVRLDKETFKALASSTRVDVLKLLDSRRYMQSEIAAALDLSVPTVKEHLTALEGAGLVERFDEGRKWKYYALTKKGKGVLHPEDLKIFIVLGTFVLGAVGTIYSFFKNQALGSVADLSGESAPLLRSAEPLMAKTAEGVAESAPLMAQEPVAEVAQHVVNYPLYVFIIVAVLSLIILTYLLYRRWNFKHMLGKSLTNK